MMCLHLNWRAHVACNFNCLIETEGLFKVTASHLRGKSVIISEIVQDGDVATLDH